MPRKTWKLRTLYRLFLPALVQLFITLLPGQEQNYYFHQIGLEWGIPQRQVLTTHCRNATCASRHPGNFTFWGSAANPDSRWGEAALLNVIVYFPWWANPYAYALYVLLLLASVLAFYCFQLKRKLALAEARRLSELDAFKSLQVYEQQVLVQPELQEAKRNRSEDPFLLEVRKQVEAHLEDPSFNVGALCRAIGMSQSQLYRKLTTQAGIAPVHFIRLIRLHHARHLLLEQLDLTIAEVAYEMGFCSPSYFSRLFCHVFGCTPSNYRKKHVLLKNE